MGAGNLLSGGARIGAGYLWRAVVLVENLPGLRLPPWPSDGRGPGSGSRPADGSAPVAHAAGMVRMASLV